MTIPVYPPSSEFTAQANVPGLDRYRELYAKAAADPEGFWGDLARRELHWFQPFDAVREWNAPFVKWFLGGTLNASYNCIDRHVEAGRGDKAAIVFEGEPGDRRTVTYAELLEAVGRFANALLGQGATRDDRAVIYMPMVPEAVIAMLACARIGMAHSVVFGGFSAEALKARIQDLDAHFVITADGGFRRGKQIALKPAVDEALEEGGSVRKVIVLRRTGGPVTMGTGGPVTMKDGRDVWWHDAEAGCAAECPAAELESEHPLFVLYTSGTTGRPKGILHTTGGYLLSTTMTSRWVFDLKDSDIYWCSADIGWVTGHSYVVYGPLSNGATIFIYEGAPDYPAWDRWWQLIEDHKVTIFYTSPTAIRALIKQGNEWPAKHDLSSLRLLGSVGEPINPAAWEWFYREIGKEQCPIVDTWWQTETGAIMISPLPGATPLKPGSGTLPLPGVMPEVVDFDGHPVERGREGFLIMKQPWPSMMRTIWGDAERYRETYWSRFPGYYFTGDAARQDEDGYYWILGRVDDVMNVSGHRLSTMEIESALVKHEAVAEAAVVGKPHEITGQAVCAFVTLKAGYDDVPALGQALRQWVAHEIGGFARPEEIRFVDALPKTRSGKIMRRLLREIVTNNTVAGDVTTLEDMGVLTRLASQQDDEH
jgi:acetyl-CoA synthetase